MLHNMKWLFASSPLPPRFHRGNRGNPCTKTMTEQEKIAKRDAVYDLIKNHVVELYGLPPNPCVCRGALTPQETWLFEKILDVFNIGYEE
jgi:hypothetical protein